MSLETWVSDQLIEILDFSDRYTSQFLTSLAHKSSSANDLIEKVRSTDTIDVTNAKVMTFLTELWGKIPRAAPKVNLERIAAKQQEQATLAMIEKNKRYKLVEDSDEEAMAPPPPPASKKIKKEKRKSESSSEDEDEKQRVRDLKERDEFSERLKLKDKDKQRNVVTVGKGIFLTYYLINEILTSYCLLKVLLRLLKDFRWRLKIKPTLSPNLELNQDENIWRSEKEIKSLN